MNSRRDERICWEKVVRARVGECDRLQFRVVCLILDDHGGGSDIEAILNHHINIFRDLEARIVDRRYSLNLVQSIFARIDEETSKLRSTPPETRNDDASKIIRSPCENDVLSGRGPVAKNHPGNERYRELICQHAQAFARATNKREYARTFRTKVSALGIRFLEEKKKAGEWEELTDDRLLYKLYMALDQQARKK